jgi:hypothetical protein
MPSDEFPHPIRKKNAKPREAKLLDVVEVTYYYLLKTDTTNSSSIGVYDYMYIKP